MWICHCLYNDTDLPIPCHVLQHNCKLYVGLNIYVGLICFVLKWLFYLILEACGQFWSKHNGNIRICYVNVYSSTWLLKYFFFKSNRGQLNTKQKESFGEFGALIRFSSLIYSRLGYLLIHTIWIFHYLPTQKFGASIFNSYSFLLPVIFKILILSGLCQ